MLLDADETSSFNVKANGLQFVKLMLYGVALPRWSDGLVRLQYLFPIAGMLNIIN